MSIEKNIPSQLKHEQSQFTTLLNETINKIKDPAALGIYCYLASKPHNWEISTKNLMNHFGRGRDFINDRLKYLRTIGALIVNDVRDSQGRFISRETLLKRTISDTTTLKTQSVDNPECGESLTTNKRFKQNKDNKENTVDFDKSPSMEYKDNPLFMRFYSRYPRKEKPRRAYQAFLKLKPDSDMVDMLIKDISLRMDNNWKNRQLSKIPHPSTYLASNEWEGDIIENKENEKSAKQQPRYDHDSTDWANEPISFTDKISSVFADMDKTKDVTPLKKVGNGS